MVKLALLMYISEFRLRIFCLDYRKLEVESLKRTGLNLHEIFFHLFVCV